MRQFRAFNSFTFLAIVILLDRNIQCGTVDVRHLPLLPEVRLNLLLASSSHALTTLEHARFQIVDLHGPRVAMDARDVSDLGVAHVSSHRAADQ